jgi:hypothetical protein
MLRQPRNVAVLLDDVRRDPDATAVGPTGELLRTYRPSAEERTDLTHHAGLVDPRLAGALPGFFPRHGRRPPNA